MCEKNRRKIIGIRLMMLRGERTQKEVALAIGTSDCAIRQYETGRCIPKDWRKEVIANYYNVTVEELFFKFDDQLTVN